MPNFTGFQAGQIERCVAGGLSRCGKNSVLGRHIELVADGRLRASDKITVWGEGLGSSETPGRGIYMYIGIIWASSVTLIISE